MSDTALKLTISTAPAKKVGKYIAYDPKDIKITFKGIPIDGVNAWSGGWVEVAPTEVRVWDTITLDLPSPNPLACGCNPCMGSCRGG